MEYNGVDLIKYVLIADEKYVGISIESMINEPELERKIKGAFQNPRVKELCNIICSKIDEIFDASKENKTLINLIKTLSNGNKKITLITGNFFKEKKYFIREVTNLDEIDDLNEDNNKLGFLINYEKVKYFTKNNEFEKLKDFIQEYKEELLELSSYIYYSIEDEVEQMYT